jgi:hypothetical protein
MTAIVAYAEEGLAFVAGDSKRVSANFAVTKVHRWGKAVVFAQAGNALHLSNMIAQMLALRFHHGDHLQGFRDALGEVRKTFHDRAVAVKKASRTPDLVDSDGMLLVADAVSGQVYAFNFADGEESALGTLGVGGVAQLAASTAQWSVDAPALDVWAVNVIAACKGATVDWPIDILLVRPGDQAGALTMQRRLEIGWAGPDDPTFTI